MLSAFSRVVSLSKYIGLTIDSDWLNTKSHGLPAWHYIWGFKLCDLLPSLHLYFQALMYGPL